MVADAKCKEDKAKAAGKNAFALLKAHGKNAKRPSPAKLTADISKAESKFTRAFVHAESRGVCLTTGDAGTIEDEVNAFIADVIEEVSGITPTTTTTTASTTMPVTTSTTTTTLPPITSTTTTGPSMTTTMLPPP